jgi:hypothetical protein
MTSHLHPDCTCTHEPGHPCEATCPVHAPHDRWAALRAEIVQERAAQDQIAADQAECGHDWSSERAYGRVEALDQMMAWMDREEG